MHEGPQECGRRERGGKRDNEDAGEEELVGEVGAIAK